MNRRTFLALSAGGLLLPGYDLLADAATARQPYAPPDIFPPSAPVKHLHVAPLHVTDPGRTPTLHLPAGTDQPEGTADLLRSR